MTYSFSFENVSNHPCQATVAFSDLDFLPIVYKFKTIPCSGVEVASFPVPKAVPNGDAFITWWATPNFRFSLTYALIQNQAVSRDASDLQPRGCFWWS